MLLESRTNYLVLHDLPDGQGRRISVSETLPAAVGDWTPGSRLSPIWLVKGFEGSQVGFRGHQSLIFLGPVQPAELFSSIKGLSEAKQAGIWLTAGCFCIVMRFSDEGADPDLVRDVVDWAVCQSIPYELWKLANGAIEAVEHRTQSSSDAQPIITRLANVLERIDTPILRPTLQENVIVTATSLARAAAMFPPMFGKLRAVADAACATMDAYEERAIGVLEMQSRLLSMNAALSRFSSQAFSGTPPIQGTECHFWIHSLLGTGSANIALANLVDSIQQVLGEARLPERLAALEKKIGNVPSNMQLVSDPHLLDFDIMEQTAGDTISDAPIIPLVTYYSGRDGFSSQLQTLSAPLTTLAECNSFRSNLLTVTHEISHIFVQSILSVISPSLGNDAEMDTARRLAKPHFEASNHLEAARQLLVEAVITMEAAKAELSADSVDKRLPELFERWRNEMQEILVHTFDFLYFHQGDPQFYVTSIWHSWCSIPRISDRVPEYLMRTLCAVAATLLTTNPSILFNAAVASTRSFLADVKPDIDPASNYVDQALAWIERMTLDQQLHDQMQRDFAARIYLVRLVKIYLYSDLLAAKLFADPYARPRSKGDEKRKLTYNTAPLGNALIFLKDQLKENPSEAESLWVLHCLAFDLKTAPGPPA